MAPFYGTLRGKTGIRVTRCGSADGGVFAHVRGWRRGLEARAYGGGINASETVAVTLTGGSQNAPHPHLRLEVSSSTGADPSGLRGFLNIGAIRVSLLELYALLHNTRGGHGV